MILDLILEELEETPLLDNTITIINQPSWTYLAEEEDQFGE